MNAIYNKSQNIFLSPYADGPIRFIESVNGNLRIENISKFGRSFSILRIPYALKLIIQELQTMNIQLRLITDENIDQIEYMNYSKNICNLNNENVEDNKMEDYVKQYLKFVDSLANNDEHRIPGHFMRGHPYYDIKDELYRKYAKMSPILFEEESIENFPEVNVVLSEPVPTSPPVLEIPDKSEIDDSRIVSVLNDNPHLNDVYKGLSMNTQVKLSGGTVTDITRVLTDVYNIVSNKPEIDPQNLKGGEMKENETKETSENLNIKKIILK